ncbi:MAG: site-specific integrase [Candidatus Eremiobacteraeota bacterium]|nr:site-specific integrase [Candidatus Eremiobacteraeota bacterium]
MNDPLSLLVAELRAGLASADSGSDHPGACQPVRQTNLSTALAERISQIRRRNKSTGQRSLISHLKLFDKLWGERQIASITTEDLETWACLRREEVKDSTIRAQLSQLSLAFEWAVKAGHVSNNPCSRIDFKFQKAGHRSRRLSRQEEEKLRASYDAHRFPRKIIVWGCADLEWSAVRFAILTGCRRMEQLQLTEQSIEAREGQDGQAEYWLHIRDGKTGPRSIPMHPEAFEIAQKWLRLPRPTDSPWIFWPQQVADRCDFGMWHYRDVFTPIRKAAGLRDFHWHDLRRTFACRLIDAGVPVFEVQRLLGHTDPKMTMIYACVEPSQLRASVLKMWSPELQNQEGGQQ